MGVPMQCTLFSGNYSYLGYGCAHAMHTILGQLFFMGVPMQRTLFSGIV